MAARSLRPRSRRPPARFARPRETFISAGERNLRFLRSELLVGSHPNPGNEPYVTCDEGDFMKQLLAGPALKTFLSAFGLIFLAELGDKTQLAAITMSAETGKPWHVF